MPRDQIGLSFSDLVVRSAIIVGLQELRTRPDWIDYAFEGLVADELTADKYGTEERDRAKAWFLRTKIPVVAAQRLQSVETPTVVTVLMQQDVEANNKLDDRHYDPYEYSGGWPDLCPPFVPTSFSPSTGVMALPAVTVAAVYVVPGQVLVDRLGRSTKVLEKLDDSTIRIARNVPLEASGLVVRGKYPAKAVTLRSAYFDESFVVSCHDRGDEAHVLWLYVLVKLTLLRVRRRLLEGRGFEVSSISGSDIRRAEYFDDASQPGYVRSLTLRGKVLNAWPDDESAVVESVGFAWSFSAAGTDLDTGSVP